MDQVSLQLIFSHSIVTLKYLRCYRMNIRAEKDGPQVMPFLNLLKKKKKNSIRHVQLGQFKGLVCFRKICSQQIQTRSICCFAVNQSENLINHDTPISWAFGQSRLYSIYSKYLLCLGVRVELGRKPGTVYMLFKHYSLYLCVKIT